MQWPVSFGDEIYQKVYDQSLEFYNWQTGQYDVMGRSTYYDSQELASYLDGENGLTVRYSLAASEEYYYEVFLPDLSVVGREVR